MMNPFTPVTWTPREYGLQEQSKLHITVGHQSFAIQKVYMFCSDMSFVAIKRKRDERNAGYLFGVWLVLLNHNYHLVVRGHYMPVCTYLQPSGSGCECTRPIPFT